MSEFEQFQSVRQSFSREIPVFIDCASIHDFHVVRGLVDQVPDGFVLVAVKDVEIPLVRLGRFGQRDRHPQRINGRFVYLDDVVHAFFRLGADLASISM